MKKILFIAFLSFSTFISAQELTSELKSAMKNNDGVALKKELTSSNKDKCFSMSNSDYTLLALAIKTKAKSCLDTLLGEGVSLEKSCTEKTPLMYAAKYGNLDAAKALIKAGANLGARNEKGRTALDYALQYEKEELATYFRSLFQ